MSNYKNILVGLDLSSESQQVIDRVKTFCDAETSVTLMYVQEPLSFAFGGDIAVDMTNVQDRIEEEARQQMDRIAQQMEGLNVKTRVVLGQTSQEIHHYAEQNSVDLIVVGSHGRHGLALLAGSVANGVVHGASCDVLAVRIQ